MSDKIRIVFRINPAEHPDLANILLSKPANERNKYARGLLIRSFYDVGRDPSEAASKSASAPAAATSAPANQPKSPVRNSLDTLGDPNAFKFGQRKTA
ncbi:MAG: hypothetical protein HKUEN07_07480 [Rhodocyclaceae bacterium]|nr:MAG: hypothetical protein HKUEN07_07480 [Rhodocyclaceae bacterium]